LDRVPKLGFAFAQSCARILVAGSPASRELFAMIGRLAKASELPFVGDVEVLLRESEIAFIEGLEGRRVLSAYARRLEGRRIWVLYRPLGQYIELVLLTKTAPQART
jgi:hypothetical protein